MPSASSPVRDALESYVAGRTKAERVVIAIAAAYYGGERGKGRREMLRPLVEVIDRASPGIVELAGLTGGAGFEIRVAERPFPPAYEGELRQAAEAYLQGAREEPALVPAPEPRPGAIGRLLGAIRRLFSSST